MYVIGTAGHVDHGKSTLVKALTGIDPDRLKEEKEREMTIDLGFAWLLLPNGEEVGIVDVPGHERFVRNMLAGVGGVDLAMLIVAADEGVMPQTREHLAILELLRVKSGLAVITKRDLVDEDWLELVTSDVQDLLGSTRLAGAPSLAVSSTTGEGLDELKACLAELLQRTPERRDLGRPRLPIDRSFVMTGFGTVVTGTLTGGSLRVGQELEVVPKGLKARIRGLQSHRRKVEEATPGRRLAVNLSGISHEELGRGDVLATPGWLTTATALDARLDTIQDAPAPVRHGASVTFHTGTFETPAKVRLLDSAELKPGQSGWVQIKLQRPAAIVKGDLFILRDSRGTLGGGEIVEPKAKRHRRFHQPTIHRLEVLEAGAPQEVILEALASHEPGQARSLLSITNLSWEEVKEALEALVASRQVLALGSRQVQENPFLYSSRGMETLSRRLEGILADYHARLPLRRGMQREEVRSRLEVPVQPFDLAVQHLVGNGALVEGGPLLRLPTHQVVPTDGQRQQVEAYLAALSATPNSPPGDTRVDPELLSYLIEEGRVVKASPDVTFTAAAYHEMMERVVAHVKEKGSITVAEARDLFGTSRKYVLALLEYLDQKRITRRVGDERVLR